MLVLLLIGLLIWWIWYRGRSRCNCDNRNHDMQMRTRHQMLGPDNSTEREDESSKREDTEVADTDSLPSVDFLSEGSRTLLMELRAEMKLQLYNLCRLSALKHYKTTPIPSPGIEPHATEHCLCLWVKCKQHPQDALSGTCSSV